MSVAGVLLLALQVAGCAHVESTAPPRPGLATPRDERERYYQMYRTAESSQTTALRWCADAWNCCWPVCGCVQNVACDCLALPPCCAAFGLSEIYSPPIVLGSGARIRDPGEVAPLVVGTPAGDTYRDYLAAEEAETWLMLSAAGLGSIGFTVGLVSIVIGSHDDNSALLLGGGGVAGLLLVGAGASLVGIPIAHVVGWFKRQLFFEQYNASLRQALGLDRSPSSAPASQP